LERRQSKKKFKQKKCFFYVDSLMDSEEVIREYQRTSRESESRLAMLNKENDELQNRVNELIKDKTLMSRELAKHRVGNRVARINTLVLFTDHIFFLFCFVFSSHYTLVHLSYYTLFHGFLQTSLLRIVRATLKDRWIKGVR